MPFMKNPEISSISSVLLNALTDPANGTVGALEALISTEFLHAIDAPSLSIIIPVVHRGLRDRMATTKRYAALISGNICTMVNDARDFVPYLPTLIPDLKSTLIDPIPDVRSISGVYDCVLCLLEYRLFILSDLPPFHPDLVIL